MSAPRWLWLSFAVASAYSACTRTNGATTTSGSGGTGGAGGAGGVPATASSGAGGMPEAGPIPCVTPYTTLTQGACDLLQQDCPDGQTCRPYETTTSYSTQCVASSGLKTLGEACYSDSECDAKLFCVAGTCTAVCCRDNDEPCNGGICDLDVPVGTKQMYVCHFAPMCGLLTPNACASGFDCHIEDPTQGLATCSMPDGTDSPDLGPCTFLNDCLTMEQCFTPDGPPGTCHYYCYTGVENGAAPGLGGCPPGQACFATHLGQKIDFGISGVGLCFPDGSLPDAGMDAGTDAGMDGGTDAGMGAGGAGGGPADAAAE
jgi:hypothetical protein